MMFSLSGVGLRPWLIAAVTAVGVGVSAPAASAHSTSSARPVVAAAQYNTALAAQPGSTAPFALIAGGNGYVVPPTNTGALGISKNSWGKASDVANGVAAVAAGVAVWAGAVAVGGAVPTLGVSAATAGTVAVVAGGISAGAWLAGSVFSYLSRDPADRNFRTIFKPKFAHLPAIKASAPQFAPVTSALHAYLQSDLRFAELATAFVTSVNRVTGAKKAHSRQWAHRQKRAAAKFARQAAAILFGFEKQRAAIADALVATGANVALPAQIVSSSQSQASQGLPDSVKTLLRALTKGSIAPSLKRAVLNFSKFQAKATSNAPQAALNLAASIPSSTAASQEDKVAGALLGFAHSVH